MIDPPAPRNIPIIVEFTSTSEKLRKRNLGMKIKLAPIRKK